MELDLTAEQMALTEMVRDFFHKESPPETVRAAEPLGFDRNLWDKVVSVGLTSVTVPEDQGGSGLGMVDLAVAAEHYGRALAPIPLPEAAAANHLLSTFAEGRNHPVTDIADRVMIGELLATLAVRPAIGGVARLAPAGAVADVLVALDGDDLVAVLQFDPSTKPVPAIPNLGSMPIADCPVGGMHRIVLASGDRAAELHAEAVARWQAATGLALVGLGARALELGVEYVLQRRAFGVLIGSFQTIQHRLADHATALDGARLLAYEAAWALDTQQTNARQLAAMSYLYAGEVAFKTAADSLQFHGGYGYTLEYDIQMYFRRAKAWGLIQGDPEALYAGLAYELCRAGGV